MADFHQTGLVTTLHRFGNPLIERLEAELTAYSQTFPIALVLPSLYSELEGKALPRIVDNLKNVPYLHDIIVSLDRATEKEFHQAKNFFSVLPQPVKILWQDGPRIQELLHLLTKNEIEIGGPGKGRSCWVSYGYILAKGECQVIAQHDCDILTYDRELLARLCYPTVAPQMRYEYCKGFYARISDRLNGRVTRLFMTPLIRSLQTLIGPDPLLSFLDSFRYPLAGEFSMVVDLAWINRVPGDWGLEVGTLAEIYRKCALRRVCQAELSETYDHKHQELSAEDPQKGLMKMATDIAKSLFQNLAIEGVILNESSFKTLRVAYLRMGQDAIKKFEDSASINHLIFDRHEERLAVEAFSNAIQIAGEEFSVDPVGIPLISSWAPVIGAIPRFFEMLLEAVELDNR